MAEQAELLFDTTALIDMYRGKTGIKKYFDLILDGSLLPYVSVLTEAELWRGLHADEVARHELIIERFISLPLDSDAARLAGSWMQKYSVTGLGWMDALTSATGKIAGLGILTRDQRLTTVLSAEANFEMYSL
jgi:predicted nucleic acid-binding protein